jgi:hypothetical protein
MDGTVNPNKNIVTKHIVANRLFMGARPCRAPFGSAQSQ